MRNWPFFALLIAAFFFSCNQNDTTQGKNSTVAPASESSTQAQSSNPDRPLYHFSPNTGWMDVPTGLVYHNEEYHIFYQHSEDINGQSPKQWGHAVSKNLTHWEHLPLALKADELGEIHSGSVVMDYNNTSGFAAGEKAAMIAIFTYHNKSAAAAGQKDAQSQGLAYSTDDGRTWTKYQKNPVLTEAGLQDPKIIWYAPDKKWLLLLAAGDRIKIFSSTDLKSWTFSSEFGEGHGSHAGLGQWSNPDLFYMPFEGVNNKGGKWILLASIDKGPEARGSATQYFLGEFDGKTFTNSYPKESVRWLDLGMDYTGAKSWSGAKIGDSRRIVSAWMSNSMYASKVPAKNWRGMLSLPRTLRLKKESNMPWLDIQVSKEIRSLNYASKSLTPFSLTGEKELTGELAFDPKASIVLVDFVPNDGSRPVVGIEYANEQGEKTTVEYDFSKGAYAVDRYNSGQVDFTEGFAGRNLIRTGNGKAKSTRIFIFADANSLEVFAEKNNIALSNLVFPNQPYNKIKVFSKGGASNVQVRAMGMKGIWK